MQPVTEGPHSSAAERARVRDRFGLVLLLLLTTVVVSIAAPDESWVSVVATLVLGLAVVIALLASGAAHRAVRVGVMVALVVVAAAIGGSVAEGDVASEVIAAAGLMLTLTTMGAIGRRIRMHAEISALTVLGAICIYVLLGLSFAFAYQLIGVLGPDPFFASGSTGTRSEYVYFSFITMATVGYGDLTAAGGVGRAAAALEGIVGQIYLVTAVAALVGNLGRIRERPELPSPPEDRRASP
jgi:Ion channel